MVVNFYLSDSIRQCWQYAPVPSLSDFPTTYNAQGGFNHSEFNLAECFQITQVSMMAQEIRTCGAKTYDEDRERLNKTNTGFEANERSAGSVQACSCYVCG